MVDATDEDLDLDDNTEKDLADDGGAPNAEQLAKEKRARDLGWVDESDWDDERAEREGRRKPSKFISADEFIERTEGNLPIMRDQMRRMEARLADADGKLNDMHGILSTQRDMSRKAVERAYARGVEAAEAKMREAVVEGDTDKFDAAKEELANLTAHAPVAEAPQQREQPKVEVDPVTQSWVAQNPWFNENYDANRAMISEHARIKKANPELPLWEQFEKAKRITMKRYPEAFNINPRREAPGMVDAPSGARQNNGKPSFDSLPQADRDAYERQRKMFESRKPPVKYSKEEFMADYAL